ncbi:hypothetical protein CSUI_003735 [Cystoisospora suis]|uniref:Transmembrane protein n=1 Tax=Cystoisospora suis TaxID=483139 RepID=A0A2C6L1D1_9APIC|nr:hypothetical protein CSUI_003735 [Cystoisospora suis]
MVCPIPPWRRRVFPSSFSIVKALSGRQHRKRHPCSSNYLRWYVAHGWGFWVILLVYIHLNGYGRNKGGYTMAGDASGGGGRSTPFSSSSGGSRFFFWPHANIPGGGDGGRSFMYGATLTAVPPFFSRKDPVSSLSVCLVSILHLIKAFGWLCCFLSSTPRRLLVHYALFSVRFIHGSLFLSCSSLSFLSILLRFPSFLASCAFVFFSLFLA